MLGNTNTKKKVLKGVRENMNFSSKQETWARDIKIRINMLLNGYVEKCCCYDTDTENLILKVRELSRSENLNLIIDEYKSLTDESLVKMFDMSDKQFCKVFKLVFTDNNYLYEYNEKMRKQRDTKLKELQDKYNKFEI